MFHSNSSGAPQQMQTLPGNVGPEMSAGCSSGGCSSASKPWQTLPMPMQKPRWPQQPWQTLPMPLPQEQAMSMEPQVQEVPRYGSVGDNLNHLRHIEVVPQQFPGQGFAPAIQPAMPRYSNWNTLPMQFNRRPSYAGPAIETPRQSPMPEFPEEPHKPDMTAPQPPVQTLPMPMPMPMPMSMPMPMPMPSWTRSYTPIGNSGRCFNQCKNRSITF